MLIDTNPAARGRKTSLADIDMCEGKNCHMVWPPCNPRLGAARDVTRTLCNTLLAEELRKLQMMPVSLAVVDLHAYTKEDFIMWHTKEKKNKKEEKKPVTAFIVWWQPPLVLTRKIAYNHVLHLKNGKPWSLYPSLSLCFWVTPHGMEFTRRVCWCKSACSHHFQSLKALTNELSRPYGWRGPSEPDLTRIVCQHSVRLKQLRASV